MRTCRKRAIAALETAENLRSELEDLIAIRERLKQLEADLAAARSKRTVNRYKDSPRRRR